MMDIGQSQFKVFGFFPSCNIFHRRHCSNKKLASVKIFSTKASVTATSVERTLKGVGAKAGIYLCFCVPSEIPTQREWLWREMDMVTRISSVLCLLKYRIISLS